MKSLLTLSLAGVLAGFAFLATPVATAAPQAEAAAPAYKSVSVDELDKKRTAEGVVVLDVRTAKEFATGHVPGAKNIDFYADDIDKQLQALDKTKTYYVMCRSGGRSGMTCEKLAGFKFPHFLNVEGGMLAWKKAGKATE